MNAKDGNQKSSTALPAVGWSVLCQNRRMALWRNRDLEDILGGKLEQWAITEAGLRNLVGEIPAEDEFVDYKSCRDFEKCGQNPTWNAKQERAICL
ncbi:hypothetical protein Pd630_LPD09092 (plasmid) [Rhodococcus opacus PD630]|nr:hypothetical protein Pd630_LPD09092 [Rhodococcus opacus PD630]